MGRVHRPLAGRLLNRVQCGQGAFGQVILEILFGQSRIRVDPGNGEDRETLIDRPLDKGIFGLKIENVILVDPGRHDQQWPLIDRLGG